MSRSLRTLSIGRRLRPIRLGFLVRPGDREAVLQAIRISTCLWGGKYNCLIPVLGKTPSWWSDRRWQPRAKDIVDGYLDAFEPDYVIATRPGLGVNLKLEKGQLLQPDDILSNNGNAHIRHGVSANDIYESLYEKTYRFERRHRSKTTLGKAAERAFQAFAATVFGAFPQKPEFDYFEKNFTTAFSPEDDRVDGNNLFEHLKRHSPLTFASTDLQVLSSGGWRDSTLYFMDATSTIDLIDFWNLRAIGWPIKPVPQQWASTLIEPCKEYVATNHVPYLHNPGMYRTTTLLRARRAADSSFQEFAQAIHVPKAQALVTMNWYPRLWDEVARGYDQAHRPVVTAEEKDEQSSVEDGRAWFTPLAPAFLEKPHTTGEPRWVNVLTFRDYHYDGTVGTLIPPGTKEAGRLLGKQYPFTVTATREGIVFRTERAWTEYIAVPDSLTVIQHWLRDCGLSAHPSGAGQTAKQLIKNLNGLNGVQLIADPDILMLLDRMAHGMVEVEGEKKKRPTHARIEHHLKVFGILRKANDNNKEMAARHLQRMLDTGILRVGLRLQCPACAQQNWYPPSALSEEPKCDRCLNSFPFPAAEPPVDQWYYRTQGSFSIEGYAQGGYAVALALRFLAVTIHPDAATWSPSLECTRKGQEPSELDFVVWLNERHFGELTTHLVLGECKSFKDHFKKKDFDRAKEFAARFPGAVIAFATLRAELSPAEKRGIAPLARRGRKNLKGERWRTPVLVLTATELMSDVPPPYPWKEAGGKFAAIAAKYNNRHGLLDLCDATQQLHLGMESYGAWLQDRQKRSQKPLNQLPPSSGDLSGPNSGSSV